MNLKEAFRYQNKLQALLDEAQGILDCDSNVTNVANTYLRHKAMAEAEDETILDLPQTEYAQQITDIARFMLYLLEEKGRLFAAIRKAKDALDMDMDSEVSLNAARQSVARTFKRMNDLRSSEQLLSGGGTGYRFNAEGNQIAYRCDVKRVTTINYDRKVIHAALGKLNRQPLPRRLPHPKWPVERLFRHWCFPDRSQTLRQSWRSHQRELHSPPGRSQGTGRSGWRSRPPAGSACPKQRG